MPRLSTLFLCPLTRRHVNSHSGGYWGYIISRSSSSSPVKVEILSPYPKRTATTRYSSTTTQNSSAGDRGPPYVDADKFPQVIPVISPRRRRTLVLCFDGTNEEFDEDITNIVRFFQLLKKDDRSKQMVYYQAGIGTAVDPRKGKPWFSKVYKVVDAAIATGLGRHVRGGYEFLMQNYTEGDRIAIFGFSRGAYTARALAGMLQKVGLLPAYNHVHVPYAYAMFKRDDPDGWKMSNDFKRAFSVDVKVDFMGVFDTVSGVGILPRKLPFSKSNSLIRVFRHALALDERRAEFKVSLWDQATEQEEKLGESGKLGTYHSEHSADGKVRRFITKEETTEDPDNTEKSFEQKPGTSENPESSNSRPEGTTIEDRKHKTDVKEVWFAGAHSDVGGGSVPNETPHHLARIPLRWMIRECFTNNTGILFHSAELEELGLSPDALWPVVKTPILPTEDIAGSYGRVASKNLATETLPNNVARSAKNPFLVSSQSEEAEDALSPIYDKLSLSRWWRILEVLQTRRRHNWRDESWWAWLTTPFSLSTPRVVQEQTRFPTYVHRSVLYRMQNSDYIPRAKLPTNPGPKWVE
ncbi:hypothetical protein BDV93DRAFT_478920 [Ceratobasidium sp. AG-I]|nr:hypothetical protein BDV93DRAFT_478920 [Ceratobasidium sp. AG-I]